VSLKSMNTTLHSLASLKPLLFSPSPLVSDVSEYVSFATSHALPTKNIVVFRTLFIRLFFCPLVSDVCKLLPTATVHTLPTETLTVGSRASHQILPFGVWPRWTRRPGRTPPCARVVHCSATASARDSGASHDRVAPDRRAARKGHRRDERQQ
jgi:hypothetical protein